ncbi:MAG: GDSL-type esterase/lipase family protein [Vicinamibacterales bacterium]
MARPVVNQHARGRWARLIAAAAAGVLAAACGDEPALPTAPTIQTFAVQCPADVLGQSADGGPVTIRVSAPTTTGGVLPATVACAPPGPAFPVGSTQVSCQATDARGVRATCSYAVNIAPPPLSATRFLAFGDSFTAGEVTMPVGAALGADGFPNFRLIVVPNESYPTKLTALLKARYFTQAQQITVTNAGVPGEYTYLGVKRLPGVLAATSPQVVLFLEGANDLEAIPTAKGVDDALRTLQTMVRMAQTSGAKVMIATLPPAKPGGRLSLPANIVQAFNDALRSGAPLEGAVVVDLQSTMTDVGTLIGSDGLHPTEAGYTRIAESFFTAIRASYEGR